MRRRVRSTRRSCSRRPASWCPSRCRVSIAAARWRSPASISRTIPPLDYQRHLFQERTLTSVTANTRADGRALLELAAAIPIRTHTTLYPLERANEALDDLKNDRVRGAAVLEVASSEG